MATKKKSTKKKAAKKTAKRSTKASEKAPTPAVQDTFPGMADERHKYHPEVDAHAVEVCDMVQQQETWRKKVKKAKPFLDAALDKAELTEYYTAKGHRAVRSPGKVTTTITLAKDKDGIMEESDDDGPTTTTIDVED